jgi:uncharacterized protein (TIGR02996 family)
MTDERAFLAAISANPADMAARLVYADWLDERGDRRAEFVRLHVRLFGLSSDDPEYSSLKAREQELRAQYPPYWLAILDPPVWCLVGNILSEHRSGPGGQETRSGTRLFRPNAKIYLADTRHCWAVLSPEASSSVQVVGQHRKSRQWILSYVRSRYTTNWRVRLVHHPGALVRLREAHWPGFLLSPGEFDCPDQRQSETTVRAFLETVLAAAHRDWERRYRAGGAE